ncbi:MAG: M20/M25/M40 family metallo-hydrolase, partial [Anaerolineales bacterium]
MKDFREIDAYLDSHIDESIAELSLLSAQPSVAAQNWGLEETANLVGEMLSQRKFDVEIMETEGAPVVVAQRMLKNSNKTLLFYNHYDVQPPEPLELWESPPFEPTLREGKLYARGVSDDKGHIVSRLFALDALLAIDGELPCNVKFIIEGEEEIGSVHLPDFIRQNREKLTADACIWEFGGVDHTDTPVQYLGMRGICYVELEVQT